MQVSLSHLLGLLSRFVMAFEIGFDPKIPDLTVRFRVSHFGQRGSSDFPLLGI